ncbi:MAG: hypothetical protein HOV79_22190 [Hamadaea sp.]|nr:hypothetical protein [Hamadaea sp.]
MSTQICPRGPCRTTLKLSQNRADADISGVIGDLADDGDTATAAAMRTHNPTTG